MASKNILAKRLQIALAIAAFAVALTCRIVNAPVAFDHGHPLISPIDELYHLKRITYSAAHFPHALELDPDRGVGGAFCPWPPLYDVTFGGVCRILGATSSVDVLRRVVWFPPIVSAIFVAGTALWLLRRFGMWTAIAAALALATSPFVVAQSAIGCIDHHWTEPFFVIAMLAALTARIESRRAGVLLGLAITAAMLVQTALLVAAALAFLIIFFSDCVAGAIAFSIASVIVALYRVTRPHGFPDNEWFLGWTHVALFAGAAVACAYVARSTQHAALRTRLFALLAGAAVVLATPSAPAALVSGAHFFGGEHWLSTIVEFQPLWKSRGAALVSIGFGLGIGAIFVWFLAVQAIRRRDRARIAIALFAIVYFALTITSRRFWSVSIPLLAIAGAVYATSIRRKAIAALATAAVALIPLTQFVLWHLHPEPPLNANQERWIAAARFLHGQPPGRVLAPWSYGHIVDVDGGRAVVIDNFGTMPDEQTFLFAHDALLAKRETTVADYCRRNGVRFLMLDNPAGGLHAAAAILGIDQNFYLSNGYVTRLAHSTWWWRAYTTKSATRFRLIHEQPQIWELRDDVR